MDKPFPHSTHLAEVAAVLNSIGFGLITADASRRITTKNPIAEKLTGWPLSEAAGQPIEDMFCIINQGT